jgi:hypothetical protein
MVTYQQIELEECAAGHPDALDDNRVFEAIGAIEHHAFSALWTSALQRHAGVSTLQV